MVARVIHSVGTIYAKLTVLTQQYANLQVEAEQTYKELVHDTQNPASYNAATLSSISLMAQKNVTKIPYEAVEISNQHLTGGAKIALENYIDNHFRTIKEAEATINKIKNLTESKEPPPPPPCGMEPSTHTSTKTAPSTTPSSAETTLPKSPP